MTYECIQHIEIGPECGPECERLTKIWNDAEEAQR